MCAVESISLPSIDSIFSAQGIDEEKYADADKFHEKNAETRRLSTESSDSRSTDATCNSVPSSQGSNISSTAKATPESSSVIRRHTKYRKKCTPCHRCKSTNDSLIGIIKPSSYSHIIVASRPSSANITTSRMAKPLRGVDKLCDSFRLKCTTTTHLLMSNKKNKQLLLENILIDGVESTATETTEITANDESCSSLDSFARSNESTDISSRLPSCVTFSTSREVYYFRR